jgi:hypothetical protein
MPSEVPQNYSKVMGFGGRFKLNKYLDFLFKVKLKKLMNR